MGASLNCTRWVDSQVEACLFISIHLVHLVYSSPLGAPSRLPMSILGWNQPRVSPIVLALVSARVNTRFTCAHTTHTHMHVVVSVLSKVINHVNSSSPPPPSHTHTATHSAAHCQMTMNIFNEKHFLPLLALSFSLSPHAPMWINTCTYLVNMHTHMYTHIQAEVVCVDVKSKQY